MESKNIAPSISCILMLLLLVLFGNFAVCDIEKDKEKCANQLVGLATCLPYVSGESNAKAPPIDCCSAFKQVVQKSPDCVCLLIKDRNDPSLGLKINATLAFTLPDRCNAHDRNISDCPALLHLPPNSPDAQVFEDFANSAKKSNTSATTTPTAGSSSATSADQSTSDGGKRKRFLEIEIVSGLLLTILAVHMLNN
ncbi:hypothetical protein BUALT_Bualt13G0120100 [Buddleja alternifolia]|uniref:Bifunctional inhibitor/plant lipid transfer protein/seed storage helical domain-containing protein n=1 Tax=Buddleja alternifolia TaxID=168488 RepID=A0AAV6WUF4_9LAMI|nr:hypothetical protein BUALT_Bualt13G0120100 [Buddleja alternifolia]